MVRELSTIMNGRGGGEIVGAVKYFAKLRGAHKKIQGSQGRHKNLFSYSTSNMYVNTTARACNWGGPQKYCSLSTPSPYIICGKYINILTRCTKGISVIS